MGATRHIVGGVLFALGLGVWGAGSAREPASPSFDPGSGIALKQFVLELDTPEPRVSRGPDGWYALEVPGFGTRPREVGAPDVPSRTVLVAIPPDADPSLEVRIGAERIREAVVPAPVPRRLPGAGGGYEDPEGDEAARERLRGRAAREEREPGARYARGARVYPERVAWLGETGYLRGQRYVELHLAPVRYDPRAGGLRVASRVEAVVRFNSPAADDGHLVLAPLDPLFEDVYRDAFVNYEQSRSFRGGPVEAEASWSDTEPAAAPAWSATEATPRQRVLVRATGLVRLSYAALQPTGLLAHDLATWRLTNRGVDVPLHTNDDGDGAIEPGEWVQFWGQALDDEPKTELNTDFPNTPFDLYEARDFTDVNTYFLFVDAAPQGAMAERDAAPTFARTPPTRFRTVVHREVDDAFRPLGGADPWYWLPTLTLSNQQSRSREETVGLPGLVSGTEPATVRVHMLGLTEDAAVQPDHLTRVTVRNGSNQTLAVNDGSFDGRSLHLQTVEWSWPGSGGQLSDPLRVQLEIFDAGASCFGSPLCNWVILDWIEIDYARGFSAVGDALVFDWPDGDAEFVVGGLQDASPDVFEITLQDGARVAQPVALVNVSVSGSGTYSVRFRVDDDPALADGTPRRFAVVGDGAAVAPAAADFVADTVSDLRDPANQADLIVIAHPAVLDASPSSPLSQLLAHRASPAGGGLSSKVVLLQDVQDEFNHGLPGPTAVREFLRWVLSDLPGEGWSDPRPTFVMLLGDGSLDYKGGTAKGDFVPTQIMFKDDPQLGYYASDNVMAAVVGPDQLADLMIARIPARSVAGANVMLQKILDYAQAPPAGAWRRRALFVADKGKEGYNPGEALQFEMLSASSEARMSRPPYTSRNLRYWTDYFDTPDPTPWDSINQDLKATVNGTDGVADGAALVQYFGHGNFFIWSSDYFWDERLNPPSDTFQDSMDLANGGRLPWLMAHNCLTGGFHGVDHNSIGENWITRPGGGAMAVFAPTGLSFNFVGGPSAESVFEDLFGPTKQRVIGPIVLGALTDLCTRGSIEACQNYALQGDPATRLVLPEVAPATAVQAVGGDRRVDLSWTASATAGARYDVWRRDAVAGTGYSRVAAGIGETTFGDAGLTNARTYQYHVVALDADGFESPWSNFNSDCAVSGPDCVQATPLNPDPPARPVALVVQDPGLGHVLRVRWQANTESDLQGYRLHWGVASLSYTQWMDTGRQTDVTLSGLTEGQTVFFAVTATNTSGRTSDYSDEASDFPVEGLGLRAPSWIEDLRLRRQSADIVLEWNEVALDIFGKPKAVSHYEILRGTMADYSTAGLTEIGQCPSPCASFTDPGAATLGGDLHYRVRAVDGEGNAGGLGSNPPEAPVLAAGKAWPVNGDLVLSWQPVASAVGGAPASIDHYVVYAADAPFSRAQIRDGAVTPAATVAGTTWQVPLPAQSRYYSVLAVDSRGNVSPY